MELVFKIFELFNYEFFGMKVSGWILSFIISCLASYLVLYITIIKDRELKREKRIEKLSELKDTMYSVRDWTDAIGKNLKKGKSNLLDTNEIILPEESLEIVLQSEELKSERIKIKEIINLIAIIKNSINNKSYLKNNCEKAQFETTLLGLRELSDELAKFKIEIKKRDLTDELVKVKIKVKK